MPRKKPTRKTRIFIGVLVLVQISALSWIFRDVLQADWEYGAEYEAARKEGAIVTAQDLRTRYGCRDEDNAAPILQASVRQYLAIPKSELHAIGGAILDAIPKMNGEPKPTPAGSMDLGVALEKFEPVLATLETTRSKTRCDFHYQWELGFDLQFPALPKLKEIAKTLAVKGLYLARQGDSSGSAKAFELGIHLGRLVADSPSLINGLAGISIQQIMLHMMWVAAAENPQGAQLRREFAFVIANDGPPITLSRALEGEMFTNWHVVNHLDELTVMMDGSERTKTIFLRAIGLNRAWKTKSLRLCRTLKAITNETFQDPILMWGACKRIEFESNVNSGQLSDMINSIIAPIFADAAAAFVKNIAFHDLALAALDVLDERQRLGHWPDRLPVFRRDPFGSAELKYRVDGHDAVIWSIGPDHVDSQGRNRYDLPTPTYAGDDIAAHL